MLWKYVCFKTGEPSISRWLWISYGDLKTMCGICLLQIGIPYGDVTPRLVTPHLVLPHLTTASSCTVLHISPMRVSAVWRLMPESCFRIPLNPVRGSLSVAEGILGRALFCFRIPLNLVRGSLSVADGIPGRAHNPVWGCTSRVFVLQIRLF